MSRTLEREIRSCNGLIIWTDCDREGENIGFEIIKVCTDIKPNIPVYRAKFSEITATSVFRALNTLGQANKNISDAVDVRQELDLRTGAAFTRLQTLRLQKVFPQTLGDKLISYGSCQFPTLGFVVERYSAIENFIPEPFWRIKMEHTIKDLTVDFSWLRNRLFSKNPCLAILDICKENPLATVTNVESKPKSRWRPLPLDTVELEKTVSRKLHITAKDTMKIAEKLYTQGFISYPRTETNIFPKEINLTTLVEQQREDNSWGPFAQRILNEGGPNPRQGRKSDQAHPPIHPTKYANNLTGNEKRIYEYIVRHFLACVSKDALGHETVVLVDIAEEKFTAKGLVILEKNYLDVYIYDKWNAKEIHEYNNGDTFMPTVLELAEGSTAAPKLLTEADLIALMEKHGIGTDATHADHIDTIKSREYVGLHQNIYFVPGTLGMGLVEGYNNIGLEISLAKPNLRAEFENDLKLISDGLKTPETVRLEQIAKYKAVFRRVLVSMAQIDQSLATRLDDQPQPIAENNTINQDDFKAVLKCPKCGKDMVIRSRKNGGKFLTCLGYPACKNAVWLPQSVEQMEVLDESCPNCGPTVKKLKVKFKQNPFHGDPNPNVLCIGGCDNIVLDTLNIRSSCIRNPNDQALNGGRTIPNERTLNNWITGAADVPRPPVRNTTPTGNNYMNNNRPASQPSRSFLNNVSSTSGYLAPPVNEANENEGDVVCNCGTPAMLLTVRKEGPNTGRKFYKCQKNPNSCNFFQWENDGTVASHGNPASSGPSNHHPGPSNHHPGSSNSNTSRTNLKCECNLNAVRRVVNKQGPNNGKQFYCCSKPIRQGCNFFKWADEVDGNSTQNGGDDDDDDDYHPDNEGRGFGMASNNNRSAGGSNTSRWSGGKKWRKSRKTKTMPYRSKRADSSQKKPRAVRKCGSCGQPGHTINKCPQM